MKSNRDGHGQVLCNGKIVHVKYWEELVREGDFPGVDGFRPYFAFRRATKMLALAFHVTCKRGVKL